MLALKQWVRDIALIMLLAYTLEHIIPFGASRRYVRIGAGLVMLLALLQPLLVLLRADVNAVFAQAADVSVMENAVADRLAHIQAAQAVSAVRLGEQLSEQAAAAVAAPYGFRVDRLVTDTAGEITVWLGYLDEPVEQPPRGRFATELAAALGVAVDVRWPEQEGYR